MQIVIFKLKDEQFAVETEKVESINDTMEITKVPNAPAYIKGLINPLEVSCDIFTSEILNNFSP